MLMQKFQLTKTINVFAYKIIRMCTDIYRQELLYRPNIYLETKIRRRFNDFSG